MITLETTPNAPIKSEPAYEEVMIREFEALLPTGKYVLTLEPEDTLTILPNWDTIIIIKLTGKVIQLKGEALSGYSVEEWKLRRAKKGG